MIFQQKTGLKKFNNKLLAINAAIKLKIVQTNLIEGECIKNGKLFFPNFLITFSNVFYNICAKSILEKANAFASLTVTYLIAAIFTFLVVCANNNFSKEVFVQFKNMNWASLLLGILIVGLEFGYIQAFRASWNISICSLVTNISLAILLIFVGILLYKEHISTNQIIGIVLCMVGLFL